MNSFSHILPSPFSEFMPWKQQKGDWGLGPGYHLVVGEAPMLGSVVQAVKMRGALSQGEGLGGKVGDGLGLERTRGGTGLKVAH